jgi:hypothetical protein
LILFVRLQIAETTQPIVDTPLTHPSTSTGTPQHVPERTSPSDQAFTRGLKAHAAVQRQISSSTSTENRDPRAPRSIFEKFPELLTGSISLEQGTVPEEGQGVPVVSSSRITIESVASVNAVAVDEDGNRKLKKKTKGRGRKPKLNK